MSVNMTRRAERGEAGWKLLVFIIVVFLAGFAGFNYIPTAYQAASFRQEMETAVIKGIALPTQGLKPQEAVKNKIQSAMVETGIPSEAFLEVKTIKNVVQARVYYLKQVELLPFGLWTYDYVFDHTVAPTGFLLKDAS